jgi:hypothetical protein
MGRCRVCPVVLCAVCGAQSVSQRGRRKFHSALWYWTTGCQLQVCTFIFFLSCAVCIGSFVEFLLEPGPVFLFSGPFSFFFRSVVHFLFHTPAAWQYNYSSWPLAPTPTMSTCLLPKQKQTKIKKYRLSIARRTNVVLFWNCSQWSRVGCTQCGVGRVVLPLLDSSTTYLAGSSESCGGQFGRSCFVLLARQVDHAPGILHLVPFHPCY